MTAKTARHIRDMLNAPAPEGIPTPLIDPDGLHYFDEDRAVAAYVADPDRFDERDEDNPDGNPVVGLILAEGPWWVPLVTDEQLRSLRDEAGQAGDLDQVSLCDDALDGEEIARIECSRVVADARDMRS